MFGQPGSAIDQKVKATGLDQLWLGRAAAMQERQSLELPLAQVAQEISFLDRLVFFHHTADEVEEQRLKARIEDLDRAIEQSTVQINLAWDDLSIDFPAIAQARRLEAVLAPCLWARTDDQREAARQACQDLVTEALAALPDRDIVDLDPAQATSTLFAESDFAYIPVLAALAALLGLSRGLSESTWEGSRPTLLYRPLIFTMVNRVMRKFKACEPESPLPIELAKRWMEQSGTALVMPVIPPLLRAIYAEGDSREPLERLEQLLGRLAGCDLCLALLRGEISITSRIAFWTDTPAEAREKQLKTERKALCADFQASWVALMEHFAERRSRLWAAHASDQTLIIGDAVRAIATKTGESSWPRSCPLLNREPAMAATRALADHIHRVYGLRWRRADLVAAAAEAPWPGETPASDHTGFVAASEVPSYVAMEMERRGLLAKYEEMRLAVEEASSHRTSLESSSSMVSIWDQINPFSETDAERTARQAGEALEQAQPRANQLTIEFYTEFDDCLRQAHPPLLVCLLIYELDYLLQGVSAESASRTERYTSNGRTHTKTVYYCTLRGVDKVRGAMERLAAATEPSAGSMLSALTALEMRALLDCDNQGLVTTLLGAGGF